jgi:hypothetical protein
LYGLLGSIAVALPIALAGNNTGVFLTLPVAALLALGYLIAFFWNLKRRPVDSFGMILVLVVGGWFCLKYANDGRDEVRWLLGSKAYQAAVLAQPTGSTGELKHIEWDGWGFAGADTTVYLAYDPDDSLATAARTRFAGKVSGVPCPVARVHRLEKRWYTVMTFTATTWDEC